MPKSFYKTNTFFTFPSTTYVSFKGNMAPMYTHTKNIV